MKFHTNYKLGDSPNLSHAGYAYGDGKGNIISHEDNSVFECCPREYQEMNDWGTFENSKWKVMSNSAWYHIDSFNGKYDIVGIN